MLIYVTNYIRARYFTTFVEKFYIKLFFNEIESTINWN